MKEMNKIVIRRMSIALTAMDIPFYGFIIKADLSPYKDDLLIVGTILLKLLLIYIEYRNAQKALAQKLKAAAHESC